MPQVHNKFFLGHVAKRAFEIIEKKLSWLLGHASVFSSELSTSAVHHSQHSWTGSRSLLFLGQPSLGNVTILDGQGWAE